MFIIILIFCNYKYKYFYKKNTFHQDNDILNTTLSFVFRKTTIDLFCLGQPVPVCEVDGKNVWF